MSSQLSSCLNLAKRFARSKTKILVYRFYRLYNDTFHNWVLFCTVHFFCATMYFSFAALKVCKIERSEIFSLFQEFLANIEILSKYTLLKRSKNINTKFLVRFATNFPECTRHVTVLFFSLYKMQKRGNPNAHNLLIFIIK